MGIFIQDAWAQSVPGPTDGLIQLLPLVVVFGIFYFLMIRPQQKRQKEHREMVAKVAVGDEIVTAGGILGKVAEISDQFVHVEVADGVTIRIQRHTIGTVLPKGTLKNA
jgi:preprotein translocase subunit YajC